MLQAQDRSQREPALVVRVDSLRQADDADLVLVDQLLERRRVDDGLPRQAAQVKNVMRSKQPVFGSREHLVKVVPVGLRARHCLVGKLELLRKAVPVPLSALATGALLVIDAFGILQIGAEA